MTNSQSKPMAYDNHDKKLRDKPILPLVDEDEGDIDDARSTTFKLRTVPSDADSAKYSFKVPILDGAATPRQAIKWRQRVNKVFVGLNITAGNTKHNLVRELCSGSTQSAYTTAAHTNKLAR